MMTLLICAFVILTALAILILIELKHANKKIECIKDEIEMRSLKEYLHTTIHGAQR